VQEPGFGAESATRSAPVKVRFRTNREGMVWFFMLSKIHIFFKPCCDFPNSDVIYSFQYYKICVLICVHEVGPR
jgi:hypothetical protein